MGRRASSKTGHGKSAPRSEFVVAFSFQAEKTDPWQGPAALDGAHRRVLQHIADGDSYDEVAGLLHLEREAVDRAMAALRRRIGAATDEHAVAIALRRGWID